MGGNSQGKDETYNATGIYNAGIENYGGDFLAKNLKITGMMQGNFIGINNSGKFAADNIDIQAVSESGSSTVSRIPERAGWILKMSILSLN